MEAIPENRSRLFWLSVLALFTAAASAALRAAVASSLKAQWIDPIAPVEAQISFVFPFDQAAL